VAIGAAIGAVWVYGSNSRLERAKWAAGLYEKFYERDHLKRIRDLLDPPTDPAVVRALVDAQPSDFTDYLNFFEFVAFLARSGQLRKREVLALFGYYVQCLRQEPAVHAYVDDTTKGYEYLRTLLNETPA
jgi:hypothetical protein